MGVASGDVVQSSARDVVHWGPITGGVKSISGGVWCCF